MKKILILSMSLISSFGQIYAQFRDDGYSSEIHKKYNAKIVFSTNEIIYQNENEAMFTNEFKYQDPIYGRMYWYPGLNNIYDRYGWIPQYGYFYQMEIYLNDELISTNYHECNKGGCTTMPLCLNPAKGDNRNWLYASFMAKNFYQMKAGVNTVTIKVYPYNKRTKEIGEIISSGSFNIYLTKENISGSENFYFKELKTYFTSGKDLWNEWKISINDKYGRLKTIEKGNKNHWEYIFGYSSGTISTVNENDFSSFELKSGDISILMKQQMDDAKFLWIIDYDENEFYLSTVNIGEGWKNWVIEAPEGKISFKTGWSIGDDLWKDWVIEDELHTRAEVKMAAAFIVMINTIK